MTSSAALRETMVASQLRPNRVTDARVLRAFLAIEREAYLPAAASPFAHMDAHIDLGAALPAAKGRFALSPMTQAWLIQAVEPRATDAALDVGAASGLSTALLGELVGAVDALEENAALADMADAALKRGVARFRALHRGPLTGDRLPTGGYDVIVVNGATARAPETLLARLNDGGRLACVLGQGESRLCVYRKQGAATTQRLLWDCSAPLLPGFAEKPAFIF